MVKMKPRRSLTEEQLEQAAIHLAELTETAGSVQQLAADAGVEVRQVYRWLNKGYISATGAAALCKLPQYQAAGFTKEALCPDVKIWYA